MKTNVRINFLVTIVATLANIGGVLPTHAQSMSERMVGPNESIQAAINAAQSGETIVIRPGIYKENLLITKDGLKLRGVGVRLEPPTNLMPTVCDASNKPAPAAPGICVAGVLNSDGSVADPVENVSITGISVNSFVGMGVSVEGARNLTLRAVEVAKNGFIGFGVRFSTGTTIQASASNDNGDSGIAFIGGSDNKVGQSTSNRNRGEGIVFLETIGGSARGNTLKDNAGGVFVVNIDVLPTNTSDITVRENVILQNNNLAVRNQYGQGNPQFQGIGVLIAGAKNVDVRNNVIKGHAPNDEVDLPPGGVVVIDTTALGGAAPADIIVTQNKVQDNAPVDLFWDGTGSNVKFMRNTCSTATPASLCK